MKKLLLLLPLFLFAGEYEDWLKSQQKEYLSYKKSIDEEFSNMLKTHWEEFENFKIQNSPYTKPKPKTTPKFTPKPKPLPEKIKIVSKPVKVQPVKVKAPKKLKPKVVNKVIKKVIKKKDKLLDFNKYKFDFFGEEVNFFIDKKLNLANISATKENISKFWDNISRINYKSIITQVKVYKKTLSLNDWGIYQLLYKLGKEIYLGNSTNANLFTWFILTKMGYNVKIAYTKSSKAYLLANFKKKVYQLPYFTINNKRFYILSPNGRINKVPTIYTYKISYPKANKPLNLDVILPPLFRASVSSKELSFYSYQLKKRIKVRANYYDGLIKFYKTYPQASYSVFFEADSLSLRNSLLVELKKYIKGMKEVDAINFLLRFAQKAFNYRTDQSNFGYEKPMFVDEVVYYRYSDCEDRAVMFSFLVRKLLNLDVVGVKFSDHMATAVGIDAKIGARFRYKGKIYTIADPTYINANIGDVMKKYKNQNFDIIPIK